LKAGASWAKYVPQITTTRTTQKREQTRQQRNMLPFDSLVLLNYIIEVVLIDLFIGSFLPRQSLYLFHFRLWLWSRTQL